MVLQRSFGIPEVSYELGNFITYIVDVNQIMNLEFPAELCQEVIASKIHTIWCCWNVSEFP